MICTETCRGSRMYFLLLLIASLNLLRRLYGRFLQGMLKDGIMYYMVICSVNLLTILIYIVSLFV